MRVIRIESLFDLVHCLESHCITVQILDGVPSLKCPRDLPRRADILSAIMPHVRRYRAELIAQFRSHYYPPKMTPLQADLARERRRNAPVVYADSSEQHERNAFVLRLVERGATYYLCPGGLVERYRGKDFPPEPQYACCRGDSAWTRLPPAVIVDYSDESDIAHVGNEIQRQLLEEQPTGNYPNSEQSALAVLLAGGRETGVMW